MIPSRGGRFEVSVDDRIAYSKLATGRHVQPGEIARILVNEFDFQPMPLDE